MTRRFAVCALTLALALPVFAAPNSRYASVLPKLKAARLRFPLLLPAWLPPDAAGRYPQATASAHAYSVDLAFADGCSGAQACTGATVSAEDTVSAARRAQDAHLSLTQYLRRTYFAGRRVNLRHGLSGYYTPPGPSADGGDTLLSWHYKTAYYALWMRGSIPAATMVKTAVSALP